MSAPPRSRPTRARQARGTRIRPLPGWAALCFFVSGAAGLLYEVVWSKEFGYLLGNSLHAVATVVAAFLGGLALGARYLGAPLARRADGAKVYALLECGVGLLGLASLPVLHGIDPAIGALYRALGGESAGFALARFAILFVLLLPPTTLMGATLPVLVGHLGRGLVGEELAGLYAVNTFGAVAGSLAGGFGLLPAIGLTGTVWIAAALNLIVAALAWRVSTRLPAQAQPPPAATREPRAAPMTPTTEVAPGVGGQRTGFPRAAFALLFSLSGFAALVFQIAWVRLFALIFGSSVYSFSAVLGVYLLGLALGSAMAGRFMARSTSLSIFGRLQVALAVAAALMLLAFARLPEWMYALGERAGARWSALLAGEALLCAGLLLVPCALLGAAFPLAARLLQVRDGGHAAGFAYAVNTLGTIAGSLAAGFFAVPAWGVQGTHLAALLISLAIGIACLAIARTGGEGGDRDGAVALVGVGAVALLAVLAPRWDPLVMSAGVFRPTQADNVRRLAENAPGSGPAVWRATRGDRVLYYREGMNGSVLVGTDEEGKERWLRVSGKTDASTGDMETQVLLGLLPVACADSGARTLVIGLGSGFTLAGALAAGAGPTRVIEIEPRVVEASRFFHAEGEQPLDDPRVTLGLGDARTRLAHARERYEVITSEPSNPWIVGVNNLFTVDFYRRVRAALVARGVFCQWMPLYELSPGTFSSMLASFLEVFPQGHAFWVPGAFDVLLMAMPADRGIDLGRLQSPAAQRLLARARIASVDALAGYYACPLPALRHAAAGAPLNRDDRPVVEYRAPRDLIEVGRASLHGLPPVIALVPGQPPPKGSPLAAVWTPEKWHAARAQKLGSISARIWLALADQRRLAGDLEGAAAALARGQENAPPDLKSEVALVGGMIDLARGHRDAALERFLEAQRLDPALARGYLFEAQARSAAGDIAAAKDALRRGLAALPGDRKLTAALAALGGRP